MQKQVSLYLYGLIIILSGVYLIFSPFTQIPFNTIKITLGIALVTGAILAFMTALFSQKFQVQFSYHEIHAISMLIYGLSILFFCNDYEGLIFYTNFLFFYYTFSEIIFCGWLFNLGRKVVFQILLIRLFLGLFIGVGSIVILYFGHLSKNQTLEGFGILFIVIGINILLYVPIIKSEAQIESNKLI